MEDLQSSEESAFVQEDVSAIIKEAIETVLMPCTYNHTKVPQWTNNVIEGCMKKLKDLNKPFKYVVTCVVMQKSGAGLHTATSCFWDNTTDGSRRRIELRPTASPKATARRRVSPVPRVAGSATLRWENKSMYCIVTVFALSL